MAYMNQERKAIIAARIKPILKEYGMKATISTDRHSIYLNVKSGKIDFSEYMRPEDRGHIQVNPYWYHEHFSGKALEFIGKSIRAMFEGNHDNSDSHTDYFDVGWYVHMNIGRWSKPYELTA